MAENQMKSRIVEELKKTKNVAKDALKKEKE